jgi:hypothetical protein
MPTKDFSTAGDAEQITFRVDGEGFALKPALSAGELFKLSRLQAKMSAASNDPESDSGTVVMGELEKIFEPDSYARFNDRYEGKRDPIGLKRFSEILEWLIGEAAGKESTPQ